MRDCSSFLTLQVTDRCDSVQLPFSPLWWLQCLCNITARRSHTVRYTWISTQSLITALGFSRALAFDEFASCTRQLTMLTYVGNPVIELSNWFETATHNPRKRVDICWVLDCTPLPHHAHCTGAGHFHIFIAQVDWYFQSATMALGNLAAELLVSLLSS